MKVGIAFANILNFGTPDGSIQFAQAAEKAGVESLWTVEHVILQVTTQNTPMIPVVKWRWPPIRT